VPGARPGPPAVRAQRRGGARLARRRRRRAGLRRVRGQRPVTPPAHPAGAEDSRRRPEPDAGDARRGAEIPGGRPCCLGGQSPPRPHPAAPGGRISRTGVSSPHGGLSPRMGGCLPAWGAPRPPHPRGQVRRLRRRRRRLRVDPGRRPARAPVPGGSGHGLGRRCGVFRPRPGRRSARGARHIENPWRSFRTEGGCSGSPGVVLPAVVGRLGGRTRDGLRRIHGAALLAVHLRRRPDGARRGEEPDQRAGRPLLPGRRTSHASRRGPPYQPQPLRGRPRRAAPPAARVRAAQGGGRALRDDPGGCGGAAGTRAGADRGAGAGHRPGCAVHAGARVPPVLGRRGRRRGAPARRHRSGCLAHRHVRYGLASTAGVNSEGTTPNPLRENISTPGRHG
jgi:hypothetical protein